MKAYLTVKIKGIPYKQGEYCVEQEESYKIKVFDVDAMIRRELGKALSRFFIKEISFEVKDAHLTGKDIEPKTAEAEAAEVLIEDTK